MQRPFDQSPRPDARVLPATSDAADRARQKGVISGAGGSAEHAHILRTLIETFGGEVSLSALGKYLTVRAETSDAVPGPALRTILEELEGRGAITLEDTGPAGAVIRLEPNGAVLAYDMPRAMGT